MLKDECIGVVLASPAAIERFLARVDRRAKSECWPWRGQCSDGYGTAFVYLPSVKRNKPVRAHRIAWAIANRALPGQMRVLHACDNPPCCNPSHLRLGTDAENVRDAIQRKRAVYVNGERIGTSVLTIEAVRSIRDRAGRATTRELAAEFRVTMRTIQNIVQRRYWKHA